ncbi:hypothetical protein CWB77_06925 [Pseudoalteromonas sp. S1610]|uniref:hypothetical protein n=1 Tax=unclassified Pseudoalteromonas TaxID=194690 RepID=UPI000D6F3E04|nr:MULTISPECIES: hypothetical protein [unclassified Pseudoalteromonas]PWS56399.1 hypothetical protein DK924_06590 [Pseudoalteromonas sp. meg-B1]TMP62509.1 hypothetical protein CWB77_06925 [Pseudoalteromonas sp. S1610]
MSLIHHFKKQYEFIENSSALFDLGKTNEAVRIATCLRVLIHDTKNSTSLFTLMEKKEVSKIRSTASSSIDGVKSFGFSLTGIMTTGNKNRVTPNMHRIAYDNEVNIDKWWNEIVFAMPEVGAFSRKDFVLIAANKDGGAHVDKLPQKYQKLQQGKAGITIKVGNEIQTNFSEMWPCLLRQLAWEFINSPDMLVLAHET